ncbi:MAG: outer membrane protein assembly factor BamD [Chthoniobacterales bacterium]|nr:outer membrane protein assembly factor BamD [Chthoniobacterales bacterium]
MCARSSLVLSFVAVLAFLEIGSAAVVFRPKEKIRYVAPGEEEINGNAQQLFQIGQTAENSGDIERAIKAYRAIVRKYPRDTLAAGAAYRFAVLLEKNGEYLKAAEAYRVLAEKFPRSANFNEAIEAQFRIGEMYLSGKKVKFAGIPVKSGLENAITIFAGIVRSAPYGKYTARAQFNIGRATEKRGNAEAAVAAYQAVIEKYPEEPVAADAQYQIGYLWMTAARTGSRDAKAYNNAKLGFQDFLFRYPKSEKAAQARENLRLLATKETSNAFQVAKFYDKQKNYKAAVIYYNDVIRQQPGSPPADQAQRRIAELRAKVGDAALQPAALTAATARPPKSSMAATSNTDGGSGGGVPSMRTSPGDVAPLPPPEADESLPPPASLTPDTTTAPDTSAVPEPGASPGE